MYCQSIFSPPIPFELAQRNSAKIGHMVGSECDLKKHVRNLGYRLPIQIGGSKTTFLERLRVSTATLTAYIFGRKQTIGEVRWQPQGVCYIVLKCHELWSTNGFKLGVSFHRPSVKSAFHFIAVGFADGAQPHCTKRWMVGRANNLP